MKRIPRALLASVSASCLFLLAACQPDAVDQGAAKPATDAAAPAVSSTADTEGLQPQYAATLAEGITFAKPGYPDFISGVSGMSGAEQWGRWTDANLGDSATFRFKQALPQKFTLEVDGYAIGPNVDQPIKVSVGSVEQVIKFGPAPAQAVTVLLEGVENADTIRLTAPSSLQPNAVDPSNMDTRKLGIALVSLWIKE